MKEIHDKLEREMDVIVLSREKKDLGPKGGHKLLREEQSQKSLFNRISPMDTHNRSALGGSNKKMETVVKYDAKTFKEWSSPVQKI